MSAGVFLVLAAAAASPAPPRSSGDYLRAYDSGPGRGAWDAEVRAGLAAFDAGDRGEAARRLESARSRGCRDGIAGFVLAACRQIEGRPADALPLLEEAIPALVRDHKGHPALGRAHNLRGAVLESLGRIPEAIEAYRAGVEAAPSRPKPLANLGRLLAASGKAEEGLAALRKAARLDPADPSILWSLGIVLGMRVETEREAEGAFRRVAVLETDPARRSAALFDAGRIRERAGDPRRALQDFEEAARVDPKNTRALREAGRILLAAGRKEEGQARLRMANEAGQDAKGEAPSAAAAKPPEGEGGLPPAAPLPGDRSKVLLDLADAYDANGLREKAAEMYKRVVVEFPGTEAAVKATASLEGERGTERK